MGEVGCVVDFIFSRDRRQTIIPARSWKNFNQTNIEGKFKLRLKHNDF